MIYADVIYRGRRCDAVSATGLVWDLEDQETGERHLVLDTDPDLGELDVCHYCRAEEIVERDPIPVCGRCSRSERHLRDLRDD